MPISLRDMEEEKVAITVCVGDIHGHYDRLLRLWSNLHKRIGTAAFGSATIIFLGDYNDRGPNTKAVLDFLISLPHRYPLQTHVFLAGNHDFAFGAFIGAISDAPPGFKFSDTWEGLRHREEVEGWYGGDGYEDMHLQARRWAGRMKEKFNKKKGMDYRGSIFDAAPTFASYGVQHGDRQGLIEAVPKAHKEFLRSLVWIHEQEGVETGDPNTSYRKLIAVHAGLEEFKVEDQMATLKKKDVTVPRLHPFFGRENVWNTPAELLKQQVLVISGHHAAMHIDRYRIIIDENGGMDGKPLAAIILPMRVIVRDIDEPADNAVLLN